MEMESEDINWTLCVICQTQTTDKTRSTNDGLISLSTSLEKFKVINALPRKMLKLFSVGSDLLTTLQTNTASYHHTCSNKSNDRMYHHTCRNKYNDRMYHHTCSNKYNDRMYHHTCRDKSNDRMYHHTCRNKYNDRMYHHTCRDKSNDRMYHHTCRDKSNDRMYHHTCRNKYNDRMYHHTCRDKSNDRMYHHTCRDKSNDRMYHHTCRDKSNDRMYHHTCRNKYNDRMYHHTCRNKYNDRMYHHTCRDKSNDRMYHHTCRNKYNDRMYHHTCRDKSNDRMYHHTCRDKSNDRMYHHTCRNKSNDRMYHHTCSNKYNDRMYHRAGAKFEQGNVEHAEGETSIPYFELRSRRESTSMGELSRCFCAKHDTDTNLMAAGTYQASKEKVNTLHLKMLGEKWLKWALCLPEYSHVVKALSVGDLASNQLYYHKRCYTEFNNSYRKYNENNSVHSAGERDEKWFKSITLSKIASYLFDKESESPGTIYIAKELELMYITLLKFTMLMSIVMSPAMRTH